MSEMNCMNLKCCANCKNQDVNDGGILQCFIEENISDYNGSTFPGGVCDEWGFDRRSYSRRKESI